MIRITGLHIVDNKLVIATEPKTFCFDLSKGADNNLNNENYSIIKHNEPLAEQKIKKRLDNYCPNISM